MKKLLYCLSLIFVLQNIPTNCAQGYDPDAAIREYLQQQARRQFRGLQSEIRQELDRLINKLQRTQKEKLRTLLEKQIKILKRLQRTPRDKTVKIDELKKRYNKRKQTIEELEQGDFKQSA